MKNLLIALGLLIATPALAQIDELPKVHARLVAEDASVSPGGSITVALEENIREGWHTYWVKSRRCRRADRNQMDFAARLERGRDPMAHAQTPAGRAADGLRL